MSKKIFIVENEFIIAEDLTMMVEQIGYQTVGYARSLSEATDRIASDLPDMVLLDVQLSGGMDGIELAQLLRQKYRIPFVFVTSFADATTRQAMEAAQPAGYLPKPFNQQDVEVVLTKVFETDHQHRE